MRRRQFGAMLATATFSLGGVGTVAAEASAQSTEPLQIEDVSVSLGGVTTSVGRATFAYQNGAIVFQLQDWTMEGGSRSLSIGQTNVVVEDASAQAFATIRAGMVEAFQSRAVSPLLSALAATNLDDSSPLQVSLGPVELDGSRLADQVNATGTVGGVVPEGTRELLRGGASLSQMLALGPSEWSQLQIQRGNAQVVATDVVMQLRGTSLSITSPSGQANVSGRSFAFSGLDLTILPPATIPAAHVEFASKARQLSAKGKLTLSTMRAAAADAGVTAANTFDAIRNARFTLSLAEVTEAGEAVVADFQTSGKLSELLGVLRQRTGVEPPAEEEPPEEEPGELDQVAVISSPGTTELLEYVFEVTGDAQDLEPGEDTGAAAETITQVDGRTRVEGAVSTGDDRIAFSGDLIRVDVPPEVQIEIVPR